MVNKKKESSMIIKQIIIVVTIYLLLSLSGSGTAYARQSSSFDLQAAIDAALPGAVIQVPPGLYQGNFSIEKPLTLEGIDWPILDGNAHGHIIEVNRAP